MKKRLITPLVLLVACGSFGALYAETILAQSCYTNTGPAEILRFGAGPVQQCNVDGVWGSALIGTFFNATFGTNADVRKTYKKAVRDAKRAYDDGVRCVKKLLNNGEISSVTADDHLYHLKTEYEDAIAAWEDWYEVVGGNMCN